MALFKKKKKCIIFFFFFEKQTDMLSEMTSDPLPPPVISWKDKSGSVGGDKKVTREVLDAPSYESKAGNNRRSRLCFYLG